MKKFAKKFLVAAMACMLAVTTVAPMTAEAAPSAPKTQTVYHRGKGTVLYSSIYISGTDEDTKITNVKSSKSAVVKPSYYRIRSDKYKYQDLESSYNVEENDGYAYVGFKALKAGTAKLSYKIDGKSFSTTIKVLAYKNPLKTANILGIKNGSSTNLASKVKSSSVADLKLSKTSSNEKVTFKANSGWKITQVEVANDSTGSTYELYNYNGLSSATLYAEKFKAKQKGEVQVTCRNTKTGASITVFYDINK